MNIHFGMDQGAVMVVAAASAVLYVHSILPAPDTTHREIEPELPTKPPTMMNGHNIVFHVGPVVIKR
jgi:hypothetical protein